MSGSAAGLMCLNGFTTLSGKDLSADKMWAIESVVPESVSGRPLFFLLPFPFF